MFSADEVSGTGFTPEIAKCTADVSDASDSTVDSVAATSGDACRQRLVAKLSQNLEGFEATFSWKNAKTTDSAIAKGGCDEVISEMKSRLASMFCVPEASKVSNPTQEICSSQPKEPTVPEGPRPPRAFQRAVPHRMPTSFAPRASTPSTDVRQQYIAALARGFEEKPEISLPGRGTGPVHVDSEPADLGDCAKALWEKFAKRSAEEEDFDDAHSNRRPPATLSGAWDVSDEGPSKAENNRSIDGDPNIIDGQADRMTCSVRYRNRSGTTPLVRSEWRRPEAPGSEMLSRTSDASVSPTSATPNSPNDELLRWATGVLQKASMTTEAQGQVRSGRRPSADFCQQDSCGRSCGSTGRLCSSPTAAEVRRRKAEDLAAEVERLNREAETECDRLVAEELTRRRRFSAERCQWQDRVHHVVNEVRGHLSTNPFATGAESGLQGASASNNCRTPVPPAARMLRPSANAGVGVAAERQDAEWARLEEYLERNSDPVRMADIPWPRDESCITGVILGDPAATVKRRLAVALRRWHPDKWRRIIDRVAPEERQDIVEKVKTITQKLLQEKKRLTNSSGLLRTRGGI